MRYGKDQADGSEGSRGKQKVRRATQGSRDSARERTMGGMGRDVGGRGVGTAASHLPSLHQSRCRSLVRTAGQKAGASVPHSACPVGHTMDMDVPSTTGGGMDESRPTSIFTSIIAHRSSSIMLSRGHQRGRRGRVRRWIRSGGRGRSTRAAQDSRTSAPWSRRWRRRLNLRRHRRVGVDAFPPSCYRSRRQTCLVSFDLVVSSRGSLQMQMQTRTLRRMRCAAHNSSPEDGKEWHNKVSRGRQRRACTQWAGSLIAGDSHPVVDD